jgi:hypothetical protein
MAGVRDHGDRDPITEFLPHLVRHRARLELVERALQVEQRRRAAGPPLRLLGRAAGGRLRLVDVRMPAFQSYAGVVARREKRRAQVSEPLSVG